MRGWERKAWKSRVEGGGGQEVHEGGKKYASTGRERVERKTGEKREGEEKGKKRSTRG